MGGGGRETQVKIVSNGGGGRETQVKIVSNGGGGAGNSS